MIGNTATAMPMPDLRITPKDKAGDWPAEGEGESNRPFGDGGGFATCSFVIDEDHAGQDDQKVDDKPVDPRDEDQADESGARTPHQSAFGYSPIRRAFSMTSEVTASTVGVGTSAARAKACTEVRMPSISGGRLRSKSCSIEEKPDFLRLK
jgi:hypothetical protein